MKKSVISLSAVILDKLNYKNTSPQELEEELAKLDKGNNV